MERGWHIIIQLWSILSFSNSPSLFSPRPSFHCFLAYRSDTLTYLIFTEAGNAFRGVPLQTAGGNAHDWKLLLTSNSLNIFKKWHQENEGQIRNLLFDKLVLYMEGFFFKVDVEGVTCWEARWSTPAPLHHNKRLCVWADLQTFHRMVTVAGTGHKKPRRMRKVWNTLT